MAIDIFGEEIVEEKEIDVSRRKYKLFDFLNDINSDKKNILRQDSDAEKDFNPFIINRGLSMNVETLMYAQEMNLRSGMTKQMVYDFYIHSIRPSKRYSKWAKDETNEDVAIVQRYYQVNRDKAADMVKLLTSEQLNEIKDKMSTGGRL